MRPRIRNSLAAGLALLLCACEHTYKEMPVAGAPSRPLLRSDTTVYVAIPPDALFKQQVIVDSGQLAAGILREAFAKHAKRASMGRRTQSFEEGLQTAREFRYAYLAYPTLLRWEDRATEMSGRRDVVEIRIELADAATGEVVHATVLAGRSRWFTDGGDNPSDLLREPMRNYAASLFQASVSRPTFP